MSVSRLKGHKTSLPHIARHHFAPGFIAVAAILVGELTAQTANAASAVVFDAATGAWAYRYGYRLSAEAERIAMEGCRRRGGKDCAVLVSCQAGGIGMIYDRRTRNGRIIAMGAACGAATQAEANELAKNAC